MCAYVRMRRDCVRKHRVVSHQWLWGRTPASMGLMMSPLPRERGAGVGGT